MRSNCLGRWSVVLCSLRVHSASSNHCMTSLRWDFTFSVLRRLAEPTSWLLLSSTSRALPTRCSSVREMIKFFLLSSCSADDRCRAILSSSFFPPFVQLCTSVFIPLRDTDVEKMISEVDVEKLSLQLHTSFFVFNCIHVGCGCRKDDSGPAFPFDSGRLSGRVFGGCRLVCGRTLLGDGRPCCVHSDGSPHPQRSQ